jgi:uncharacterized protein
MQFSKHNIFSKIHDSENYFILNLLSRSADILEPAAAERFSAAALTDTETEEYISKGYVIDPDEEKARYRQAYLDFIEARENSEIQLFFVPTYGCNFSCSYCYQNDYSRPEERLDRKVLDAFYRYLDTAFAGRSKYITIFGGEPLLPGEAYRAGFEDLVEGARERKLSYAVVTNGYHLTDYLDILSKGEVREIQVTLDGPEEVHDRRRPLAGGGPTFGRIVEGIEGAMEEGMTVNLRVVVDRDNLPHLPELARYAGEKGWTGSPLFKTQLGRNYELHTCSADPSVLFSRAEMYEALYGLLRRNPEVGEFHRPAYSISRFLFDNGELPDPLFDSCPGCKTEWAFDYAGRIYSCTATVGKEGEELGTFYPRVRTDDEVIEEWEERDVTAIGECRECALSLACGGGCASVAKNRTGKILSPDCRPVKELVSMGISHYFGESGSGEHGTG